MAEIVYDEIEELDVAGRLGELADLYVQVYAEPPYFSAPKYSRESFLARTRNQLTRPCFRLMEAKDNGHLLGFAFGFQMAVGAWWANAELPPPEILHASKFAVIELVVEAAARGRGIGRELMQRLLSGRSEEYATLAAVPDAPAHDMYLRWGWKPVGRFSTPPYSEAMILRLARET